MAATLPLRSGVDAALRGAVAGSIRLYQLWLSPHKGFCCAYRYRTGRCSCSEYARRLVLRQGAFALLRGLPRQFARCRAAFAAIQAEAAEPEGEEETPKKKEVRRRSWSEGVADACTPGDCTDLIPGDGALDCIPCDCSF